MPLVHSVTSRASNNFILLAQPTLWTHMSAAGDEPAPINVSELPYNQLLAVKQQMDEEIQVLTGSFSQLKRAQAKFASGAETLTYLDNGAPKKQILVPLTNSLYVSGESTEEDKVLVDVGTGYFVEKTRAEAKDFYKRKLDFVKSNAEKLQGTINQRSQQRAILLEVIQSKVAELRQTVPAT